MKKALIYSIFFFLSVVSFNCGYAQLNEFDMMDLKKAYRTLSKYSSLYVDKKKAIARFNLLLEKTDDRLIIEYAVKLLKYYYDNDKFNEQNDQIYYNDLIAKELVMLIGRERDPKGFEVFVVYVMKMNHTDETINAVWWAMQQLDWEKANLK